MMHRDRGGTIYLIKNLVNDKGYVGLTTRDVLVRFEEHVSDAQKPTCKHAIHLAIRKHGVSNFVVSALETCDTFEELKAAEKAWIVKLETHVRTNKGYNMTDGGDGVIGYEFTDAHRNNMSLAHRGKVFSERHRENLRLAKLGDKNPMHGKRQSAEYIEKRISKLRGKKRPAEIGQKISVALKGKKQTWTQPTCRKVTQLTLNTLQPIMTYVSLNEAARSISDRASPSNIRGCCTGMRPFAYGFKWQFAEQTGVLAVTP